MLAIVCDVTYFALAVPLRSIALVGTGLGTLGFIVGVLIARRRARRDDLEGAVSALTFAFLATVAVVAPFFAFAYSTLVLACLMAVAVALQTLRGARLRRLAILSFVIATAVTVYGVSSGGAVAVPQPARSLLVVLTGAVCIYLVLLLLWQFSTRLRASLDRAEASERDYRHLVETVPQLTWVTAPDGTVEYVSGRWREYTGLADDESLRGEWQRVIHPDDLERCTSPWRRSLATGEVYESEYRLRRASDGAYRWFIGRALPLRGPDGAIVRWFGTCTDIDDQKCAQAAVRASETRFRQVALATAQVVWTATAAGRVDEASPSWCAFTGQEPEAAYGDGWLDAVHPDDRGRVRAAWARAIERGGRCDLVHRLRRQDGTWADMISRSVPVRDADGGLREWVVASTDVTERKRADEQLLAENRRKDEFLAMLGHELRNPLAPVLMAVEMMKLRADGRAPRELEVIERQTRTIARLVDDLLDVSRITRGIIQLRREPVELAEVVARAVEAAQALVDQRGHRLTVDVPSAGLPLDADPVRLAQAVANLVQNAAKYSDGGGAIDVRAWREGDVVVLRVRDRGIGIAPEILPHVFDLFAQGDRGLDRSQGGLGIGLTIVRRLVEMHDGTVTAHSGGVGRGSEFVVHLPARAAVAAGPRAPSPRPAGIDARRVLVVDDNRDAAVLLAEYLSACGFEVQVADDGPEALRAASELQPDAVLLDIGLPGMSGYEVAARLRQDPELGRARLIAVTGYGQVTDRARARAAGFDEHLVKPVDLGALRGLLGGGRRLATRAGG